MDFVALWGIFLSPADLATITTNYEYDDTGRLVAVILPPVIDATDGLKKRPRYEYTYAIYGNQVGRGKVSELFLTKIVLTPFSSFFFPEEPAAPVEVGHRSGTVCHLGNIALRLNTKVKWDPINEQILDNNEASNMINRQTNHSWKT